ncbi:hypothetical protein M514_23431, partial [Trichuris suis]
RSRNHSSPFVLQTRGLNNFTTQNTDKHTERNVSRNAKNTMSLQRNACIYTPPARAPSGSSDGFTTWDHPGLSRSLCSDQRPGGPSWRPSSSSLEVPCCSQLIGRDWLGRPMAGLRLC